MSEIFLYMDRIQGQLRENTYQRKHVYSHILPSETFFTYSPGNIEQE